MTRKQEVQNFLVLLFHCETYGLVLRSWSRSKDEIVFTLNDFYDSTVSKDLCFDEPEVIPKILSLNMVGESSNVDIRIQNTFQNDELPR